MNKVHYRRQLDSDTACGRNKLGTRTALEWAFVTCKQCLKHREPVKKVKRKGKVTHKYNINTQTISCGRGLDCTHSAANWVHVTCKQCLKHLKAKPKGEGFDNGIIHRYNVMGKTLCGIDSIGHRTGRPKEVTCPRCLSKMITEQPRVIHKYQAHNKPAVCGEEKLATQNLSAEWCRVTCKECLKKKPLDITEDAGKHLYTKPGGKPEEDGQRPVAFNDDHLVAAMRRGDSIEKDIVAMIGTTQDRVMTLTLQGLYSKFNLMRTSLMKGHTEMLEKYDGG